MPAGDKFKLSKNETRDVFPWIVKVATSTGAFYRLLRAKLRAESGGHIPRTRSERFLEEMHSTFDTMKGCSTDISCLKYLFKAALLLVTKDKKNKKNEKPVGELMSAINILLARQFPLEEQLDLPARFVQLRDGQCRQCEVVCQKNITLSTFRITITDST